MRKLASLGPVLASAMSGSFALPHPSDGAAPEQPQVAPRVLLVDDCPVQLLLGCVLLARWQIVPEMAKDGVEAVLLAGEQEFDLLLMDVAMPVMDGLTATRRIRQMERQAKREKRVPVVAYTESEVAFDEGAWRASGMDAMLRKPSAEMDMGLCLKRWCPDNFLRSSRPPP